VSVYTALKQVGQLPALPVPTSTQWCTSSPVCSAAVHYVDLQQYHLPQRCCQVWCAPCQPEGSLSSPDAPPCCLVSLDNGGLFRVVQVPLSGSQSSPS
jgi:hypothetical protein